MQAKRGRVENGVVVLSEPTELAEGTEVMVLVRGSDTSADASDEELAVIDEGLAQARDARRIDARAFLEELRQQG